MSNNDRKPSSSSNCLTSKQNLNHSCKIKEHYEDLKDNTSVLLEDKASRSIIYKKDSLRNKNDHQFENTSVSILTNIFSIV